MMSVSRFHDICVSNIDCLWNESGVHSKHSFWRIRGLYCDLQVLQVLLNECICGQTAYTAVFLLTLLAEQAAVAVSGVAGRS
jgi:hypothetical protein